MHCAVEAALVMAGNQQRFGNRQRVYEVRCRHRAWLHEIKHDGFRVIARKDGNRARLYSRPGNDMTRPASKLGPPSSYRLIPPCTKPVRSQLRWQFDLRAARLAHRHPVSTSTR
jgi:hypothetical protein